MEGRGVRENGTLQEFQVSQYCWGTENKEKTKEKKEQDLYHGGLCM